MVRTHSQNSIKKEFMKLYLISQAVNKGYDTYDSAVVCAPDEATARSMSPRDGTPITAEYNSKVSCWVASPKKVRVTYIGEASPEITQCVLCASFNAG
jgi:hypothetical protein